MSDLSELLLQNKTKNIKITTQKTTKTTTEKKIEAHGPHGSPEK